MNEILAAYEIMKKIVMDNEDLASATKAYFALHFYTREKRKIIQALVVRALMHQFVLENMINDSFPSISKENTLLILVALTNTIFVKALEDEETIEKTKAILPLDANISLSMLEQLLTHAYDANHLVPSYVRVDSTLYKSYQYNIPTWLIDMWNRHYGSNVTQRLLMQIRRKKSPSYRINALKMETQDFLAREKEDFKESSTKNTVLYMGKLPMKRLEAYRHGEILPLSEGASSLIDKVSSRNYDDALIMVSSFSYFPLALLTRKQENPHFLLATPTYPDVISYRRAIELYGANKVEVVESPLSLLITYVSEKKDQVWVLPPSSSFQYISERPDFFTHFSKDEFDELLDIQRDYLEECATFVKEGGTLIYFIETANNKEGTLQIHRFLDQHDDFVLLEEKQMLPLDKKMSMGYFAILKKGETQHD